MDLYQEMVNNTTEENPVDFTPYWIGCNVSIKGQLNLKSGLIDDVI